MVNWRKTGFIRLATTLTGILGVIALAGGLVFGQNFSAAISGFVRDTTGAVIPGTTVTAKHTETGLTTLASICSDTAEPPSSFTPDVIAHIEHSV